MASAAPFFGAAELFFHVILAGLHARNQLETVEPSVTSVLESIGAAVKSIDELAPGAGSTLNMILSNGRMMYALRRGSAFGYTEHVGLQDPADPREVTEERARPGSPLLHYFMLVSGGHEVPKGYETLPDGVVATLNRDLQLNTHAL